MCSPFTNCHYLICPGPVSDPIMDLPHSARYTTHGMFHVGPPPFSSSLSQVSIKIKKHTDEAVWIRVAWGDSFTRPNHMKPTYVVHHLQTPYVFVSNLTAKHRPLLNQVRGGNGSKWN